jgi:hypothetical protein
MTSHNEATDLDIEGQLEFEDQTDDIARAMNHVGHFTDPDGPHRLRLSGIKITPREGAYPAADILLWNKPLEFAHWCQALPVDLVSVERRGLSVILRATVDSQNVTYRLASSMPRSNELPEQITVEQLITLLAS